MDSVWLSIKAWVWKSCSYISAVTGRVIYCIFKSSMLSNSCVDGQKHRRPVLLHCAMKLYHIQLCSFIENCKYLLTVHSSQIFIPVTFSSTLDKGVSWWSYFWSLFFLFLDLVILYCSYFCQLYSLVRDLIAIKNCHYNMLPNLFSCKYYISYRFNLCWPLTKFV